MRNNTEEINLKDTYEKSLSLLALKDTHREESKVKEKIAFLEKIGELRAEHDEAIRRKDDEVDRLRRIIKEKDRLLDDHDVELEKLKLKHRQSEWDLRQKIDDIQVRTSDLRWSREQFNTQLQFRSQSYEDVISKMQQKEKELKEEIKSLKEVIKKINNQNHNLETLNLTLQRELSSTREPK